MDGNHFNLISKAHLVHIIAEESINFFNRNLPQSEMSTGVRICLTDRATGEDILQIPVGTFPLEKSEKYFQISRSMAKQVSGNKGSLTSMGYNKDIPQGGVQGALYGVGVFGLKTEYNEAISGAIIFFIEKNISSNGELDYRYMHMFRKEHYQKIDLILRRAGRNKSFAKLMNHLMVCQNIMNHHGFSSFKRKVLV